MIVKVWNNNVHPYSEKFEGRTIDIPSQSFIEMDEDEALVFAGKFTFPKKDAQGVPDPKFFKMLKIEYPPKKEEAKAPLLMNHATGKVASSVEELHETLQAFADRLVKDPEAEEFAKKQNKKLRKENDELKVRLQKLEEKIFGVPDQEKVA